MPSSVFSSELYIERSEGFEPPSSLLQVRTSPAKLGVLIVYLLIICTGGEIRTPIQWFWRPLLGQLSFTRIRKGPKPQFLCTKMVLDYTTGVVNVPFDAAFTNFQAVAVHLVIVAVPPAVKVTMVPTPFMVSDDPVVLITPKDDTA